MEHVTTSKAVSVHDLCINRACVRKPGHTGQVSSPAFQRGTIKARAREFRLPLRSKFRVDCAVQELDARERLNWTHEIYLKLSP